MEIQPDFRDLLELFNKNSVEYVIVGGYALAFHGAPRYTGDLDILVNIGGDNPHKIMQTLKEFGFGAIGLSIRDFSEPGKVIQLGYPPVRIDIVTSISGVSWKEAFQDRVEGTYGGTPIYFIGRKQLVANKRTVGRQRDLADLEALGEA